VKKKFRVIAKEDSPYWPKDFQIGDVVFAHKNYSLPFQNGYTAMVTKTSHDAPYPHYGLPLHCLEEIL
jgi:hypothetical protein